MLINTQQFPADLCSSKTMASVGLWSPSRYFEQSLGGTQPDNRARMLHRTQACGGALRAVDKTVDAKFCNKARISRLPADGSRSEYRSSINSGAPQK